MPPRALIPLETLDLERILADIENIRKANPQRFEMEQLTGIVHYDAGAQTVGGYLDIEDEPFWARGHIPGRPLMPGVIMIEAAAQLCSWAVRQVYDDEGYGDRFFGFGGIDNTKFRGVVFPGSRLILLGQAHEVRPRRATFKTQGWVDGKMVFQSDISGMWI